MDIMFKVLSLTHWCCPAGSASPSQCALICSPDALNDGCPAKASCKAIVQGHGVCTYDS